MFTFSIDTSIYAFSIESHLQVLPIDTAFVHNKPTYQYNIIYTVFGSPPTDKFTFLSDLSDLKRSNT